MARRQVSADYSANNKSDLMLVKQGHMSLAKETSKKYIEAKENL